MVFTKPKIMISMYLQQNLSASLKNKSYKRLRSRPKRSVTLSIKPRLALLNLNHITNGQAFNFTLCQR